MSDFAKTHARTLDPDTSHESAAKAETMSEAHCNIILEVLALHGPRTADEISKLCQLDKVQIGRRTSDLIEKKLIHRTGVERLNSNNRNEDEYSFTTQEENTDEKTAEPNLPFNDLPAVGQL